MSKFQPASGGFSGGGWKTLARLPRAKFNKVTNMCWASPTKFLDHIPASIWRLPRNCVGWLERVILIKLRWCWSNRAVGQLASATITMMSLARTILSVIVKPSWAMPVQNSAQQLPRDYLWPLGDTCEASHSRPSSIPVPISALLDLSKRNVLIDEKTW